MGFCLTRCEFPGFAFNKAASALPQLSMGVRSVAFPPGPLAILGLAAAYMTRLMLTRSSFVVALCGGQSRLSYSPFQQSLELHQPTEWHPRVLGNFTDGRCSRKYKYELLRTFGAMQVP